MFLLAESVREAPSEIEKEKNRATLRFGDAFQYGDFAAICSLQKVASQLQSGFFNLLNRTEYDQESMNIAQLVDAADLGRHTTIATLHDLKQRLVRSAHGAYQPPQPQSHPAYQSLKHSSDFIPSPRPLLLSRTSLLEQRYDMPSLERGLKRGVSTSSATSDDASIHVHFHEEDVTPRTAGRCGSALGFLRNGRRRNSKLLVDSKQKSDELAMRKMKGDRAGWAKQSLRLLSSTGTGVDGNTGNGLHRESVM